MGGYGSGRPQRFANLGGCLRLDLRKLKFPTGSNSGTAGRIDWSNGSSASFHGKRDRVVLVYRVTDSHGVTTPVTEDVDISWVHCHLGGVRFFGHCPRCGHRSLVLYLYGTRFVCRHCTRLRYRSQTVDLETRVTFAIRRLQKRLAPNFDPDDLDIEMVPSRPRGMRRRTYRRLAEKTERLIEVREDIWNVRIFRLMRRMGAVPDDLLKLPAYLAN